MISKEILQDFLDKVACRGNQSGVNHNQTTLKVSGQKNLLLAGAELSRCNYCVTSTLQNRL